MSLTVEKLNDDSSFLLAFAPTFAPQKSAGGKRKFPGAFTILTDPWLAGTSSILHPAFQISRHTASCAIESLNDLEEQPDLIVCSQDKPDHCHRETLCALPKDSPTRILATPAAAKKIRSWKHFDSSAIHVMPVYSSSKPDTVIRISLPAYTSSSSAGEITICNVGMKHDLTGLHNALGITYRPPGSLLTALEGKGGTINLSDMMRPATSPTSRKRSASIKHTDVTEYATTPPPSPPDQRSRALSLPRPIFLDPLGRTHSLPSPPSPPSSPMSQRKAPTQHQEPTLSLIYTPHGVPPSALTSYKNSVLRPVKALPITALFHCMNSEQNPRILGGKVARGAPGGVEVARELGAKWWISAHDEHKRNEGVSTKWIKSRRYGVEEVKDMLGPRVEKEEGTNVVVLAVGESLRIVG